LFILSSFTAISAQVDSAIAQITSSPSFESFVGDISGDGRFVVFESKANVATENPRNADGNLEVFLFDYAQRRIFQITDTKNLLVDATMSPITNSNIRVVAANTHPVISNDGKWIALSSNATCNFPGNGTTQPQIVNGGNPGSFDPNMTTVPGSNPAVLTPCYTGTVMTPVSVLPNDGNTEMWFYRIPDVSPADLSQGLELPLTELTGGTFIQATNTLPSRTAVAGTTTTAPVIADDNRNPAINDDGGYVAFMSNRDLKPCTISPIPPDGTCGNASPGFNNDEIFLAVINGTDSSISQITATPKGTIQQPSSNENPAIMGNGLRIAFSSTANNPIVGMTGGNNTDNSLEIFYADVDSSGGTTGTKKQITQTTPSSPGGIVNIFSYGKRMSRDGRYIGFDSFAELENAGAIQTSFATYVYDANTPVTTPATNPFIRVLPRSDADAAATGGDLRRFPTFTDYTNGTAPDTLVFETRMNITSTGTIPATAADGLNPDPVRPAQVYSSPISALRSAQTFKRLTKLPAPSLFLAVIQPFTSNSLKRLTFNISRTEPGTGNPDLLAEAFYLLTPTLTQAQAVCCTQFYTGASRITVSQSPVPTPSPSATPSATPTPSPSATPMATPTPQTPPAVQGVSPGMLAIADVTTSFLGTIVPQTAVGSLQRRFTLPIELSGVSMTVNGVACGLKKVSSREITFVVPPAIQPRETPYDFVISNNGRSLKGTLVIVITRPDVFTFDEVPGPGGRAQIFNATNRVLTREPFNVTTLRYRGGRRVPTVLRLYLTGVEGAGASNFQIRVGGVPIPPANILTGAVLREPGVYTVDFTLPASLDMAGDVPVIVQILAAGITYSARLDDTAPFFRIL
ncbi:MAG: hypothetical protein ABIP06_06200, partial [Pyrinomonadaceae bacterium]